MGAWGTGPFDNDTARDWFTEIEDLESVEEALELLAREIDWPDGASWLEAAEAEIVVATGELVAAALGRPAAHLPEEVRDWLATADLDVPHRDQEMIRKLIGKVHKSGLSEVWSGDEHDAWAAGVTDLERRLRPIDPTDN